MMTTTAVSELIDEAMESVEFPARINGFHLEPRCRVCRNDQVRKRVNDLLAGGASYAMVLRALGDDNAKLEKRDRVTVDSIRNHCGRHFPVQQVARATYRDILERRARENQVDFVNGVATAITPMAFLETVMVKGYQTLVDERTTVSYRDGMEAALKLAEALRRDEGEYDPAHMLAEMGRVIDAVREFVPREKWPELQAKLRGKPPPPSQIASARVSQAPPVRPHQRPGRGRVMSECSTCPPGAESVVEYRNGQPDQHDQSQDLRPAPVVKACGTYRHTARPGRRSPTPRPGEAELTRLQSTLRKYEEGRAWEKLNGFPTGRRDELIKHLQDRFDHLAGVPKSTTDPAR